jgi:hypothetical protein
MPFIIEMTAPFVLAVVLTTLLPEEGRARGGEHDRPTRLLPPWACICGTASCAV